MPAKIVKRKVKPLVPPENSKTVSGESSKKTKPAYKRIMLNFV